MALKAFGKACVSGVFSFGAGTAVTSVRQHLVRQGGDGRRSVASGWERESFRGTAVSLLGGLDVALSALAGASPLVACSATRAAGGAAMLAGSVGAIAGYVDDHLEAKFPAQGKGFRGHLGALKRGQVTSGLVKIVSIGVGSLGAAAVLAASRESARPAMRVGGELMIDALLIAGTANFINLLDLRPGRALKATGLAALPHVGASTPGSAPLAGSLIGVALAGLPSDLRGETMLGDLGANALGAQFGVLLANQKSLPLKASLLSGVIALTLVSEKVSFSQVISRNDILRALDQWGVPGVNSAGA
ncbi:MAG: hypothetical protein PUK40_00430 [Actinomycetaceae bacterium]|nr:hypothetical protein [Arcanobacterium sp.]MDD7504406.1 hypothetical protein [Actinomycetaceae bacterium]MDY6143594.1 hypothetical protein [Arcanobacterium sp.]